MFVTCDWTGGFSRTWVLVIRRLEAVVLRLSVKESIYILSTWTDLCPGADKWGQWWSCGNYRICWSLSCCLASIFGSFFEDIWPVECRLFGVLSPLSAKCSLLVGKLKSFAITYQLEENCRLNHLTVSGGMWLCKTLQFWKFALWEVPRIIL